MFSIALHYCSRAFPGRPAVAIDYLSCIPSMRRPSRTTSFNLNVGTIMTIPLARFRLFRALAVAAGAIVLSASECPLDNDSVNDGDDGGNGGGTPSTATATSIMAATGSDQNGTVGTALAEALVAQVNDQSGNPMSGVSVTFVVSAGGGSVGTTSTTTGSDGRASTTWTLGTTAGTQQVTGSASSISTDAVFIATATADVAASFGLVSGNEQNGLTNTALTDPIVVRVLDQYDNVVAGETVTFSVASGGGSISPATATTDSAGDAQAMWTLGAALGANTAQASVTGLAGSPVSFTATAMTLSVAAVSPDPLVEGGSATITGTGFDLTPGNNTVTVDGTTATVTKVASATSMTVTVPSFDCRPERTVDVVVSVSGSAATLAGHPLEPLSQLALNNVGDQTMIEDASDFCLQFAASATGGDEYLIGVGSVAEIPGGTMPFTITSVTGASGAPPAMLQRPSRSAASRPFTPNVDHTALRQRQAEVEAEIRAYESRYLDPINNPGIQSLRGRAMGELPLAAGAMAVADTVGHVRDFRVPGSSCSDYTEITATAREVGASGIWYTDNANPTTDSLTQADIESASTLWDDMIFPFDTTFFGAPSDIDGNSKIVIVLTKEVNATGAAGFVYSGDLYARSTCAYSDSGEIFYGFVPDPGQEFGPRYTRSSVTDFLPVLIAHEFTHNIQISRRAILLDDGVFPASWIAEGQATFAEEVVGHHITGNSAGNDYGASVATSGPPYWYWQGITKLGYYFGDDNGTKLPNTPEDCTLFGDFSGNIGICNPSAFYGASWSMLRYLTDRFYSGSASSFHKDIISLNPGLFGVENIEAVTGMSFDSLFAQWWAMLYVDNRVTGAPGGLTMTSWDLPNILSAVASTANLDPVEHPFAAFSDSRSVRGGSHAYTLVSAAGARPALAIRVRDGSDGVLGTSMTPILWIVRVQ